MPWLQVAVEEAVLVDNSLAVLVDLLNVLRQKKSVGPQWLLCGCDCVPPTPSGGCGPLTCARWCCPRPTGLSSASMTRECSAAHGHCSGVLTGRFLPHLIVGM